MTVRVGDQCQISSSLHRRSKLSLIFCLCPCYTTWNNLTGLRNISPQSFQVFVVNFLDPFCGELAKFSSSEITCHGCLSFPTRQARRRCRSRQFLLQIPRPTLQYLPARSQIALRHHYRHFRPALPRPAPRACVAVQRELCAL